MVEIFNLFIKILNDIYFLIKDFLLSLIDGFLFHLVEKWWIDLSAHPIDKYLYLWYFISFCIFMLQVILYSKIILRTRTMISFFIELKKELYKCYFYAGGFLSYLSWYAFWDRVFFVYNNYIFAYLYIPENYQEKEEFIGWYLSRDLRFVYLFIYFIPRLLLYRFMRWILPILGQRLNIEIITFAYFVLYVLSLMFKEFLFIVLHFKTVFDNNLGEAATLFERRNPTKRAFWGLWNYFNTNLVRLHFLFLNNRFIKFISLLINFSLFSFYCLIYFLLKNLNVLNLFKFHEFLFSRNKFVILLSKFSFFFNNRIFHLLRNIFYIYVYLSGFFCVVFFEIAYILFFFSIKLVKLIIKVLAIWFGVIFIYYSLRIDCIFSQHAHFYYFNYIYNWNIFIEPLLNFNDYINLYNSSLVETENFGKTMVNDLIMEVSYADRMRYRWKTVNIEWARRWPLAYAKFYLMKFCGVWYYKYHMVRYGFRRFYYMLTCPTFTHMYFFFNYTAMYWIYSLVALVDYIFIQLSINWFTFIVFKCLYVFYDFDPFVGNIGVFINWIFVSIFYFFFDLFEFFYKIFTYFLNFLFCDPVIWCLKFTFDMSILDWIFYLDVLLKLIYYYILSFIVEMAIIDDYTIFLSGSILELDCALLLFYLKEISDKVYFNIDFLMNYFGLFPKIGDFNYYYKTKRRWFKLIYAFKTANSFNYFTFNNFKFYELYALIYNNSNYDVFNNMRGVLVIEFIFKICIAFIIFWLIFPNSFRQFTKFYRKYYRSPEYIWKMTLTNVYAETNEWIKGSLVEFLLPNYFNKMSKSLFSENNKEFKTWVRFKKVIGRRLVYIRKLNIEEKYDYIRKHIFWHIHNHLHDELKKELDEIWEFNFHEYLKEKDYRKLAKIYGENPRAMNAFIFNINNRSIKALYWRSPDLVEMDKHAHFYLNIIYGLNEKFHRFFDYIDKNVFNNYSPIWLYGINNDIPTVTLIKHESREDYWCGYDNDDPLLFEFFNAFFISFLFFYFRIVFYYWGYRSYVWDPFFIHEPWLLDLFLGEFSPFYHVSADFWGFFSLLTGGTETMPTSRFTVVSRIRYGYSYLYYLIAENMFSNNYFFNCFNTLPAFITYQIINLLSYGYVNIIIMVSIFLKIKVWKYSFVMKTKSINDVINMGVLIRLYNNAKYQIFC